MLGDSMRRRHKTGADRKKKVRRTPRAGDWRGRLQWAGIALAVLLATFGVGYGVAVQVLYPAPETSEPGVEVPGLIGRSADEARDVLAARGFEAGTVYHLPSSDASPGTVVAQSPVAGQQLREGGVVAFAVSGASDAVIVPDVAGFGAEAAEGLLEDLGFRVERRSETAPEPAGQVLRTRPAAGEEQTLPATVELVVSTGPPEIESFELDSSSVDWEALEPPVLPEDSLSDPGLPDPPAPSSDPGAGPGTIDQ